ncbi:hypothetical protein [Phenylobacterium sp.]|uniref:glycosyltransferase family protein n=1 Tax=Phenylobacterium sp. TaxID=1871053 RepID=UPI0035B19053
MSETLSRDEAAALQPADAGVSETEARARGAFRTYQSYCDEAERLAAAGDLRSAAVYAAIAAQSAVRPHAGFFRATRLERLLAKIGLATTADTSYRRAYPLAHPIRKVLHVCTTVAPVGGLRNMLGHWIRLDTAHQHSIALINHSGPVVETLTSAVAASGGRLHKINRVVGGYVEWAQELRRISESYDAVVLHVYSQDVTPILAFADPRKRPPVMLLNHGDHLMWLGVSVSDVVINLRDAAQALSINRRGVEPRRNVMVPTIVAPQERKQTRQAAKQALGLDPDGVFLFSAARPMKYRSVDGVSFADTHVELLKRHPNAVFWVLGPGEPDDWREACDAVGGRMRGLAESPNTRPYFEAADIYVDSYPFVSSTSLMEAAGFGSPLVSRFYGPKEAEIFAINHPGLVGTVQNPSTEAEYVKILDELIDDPARREALGAAAQATVRDMHTPPGWLRFVAQAYELAERLPPIDTEAWLASAEEEVFSYGEPDRRLYEVFGLEDEPVEFVKQYVRILPFGQRMRLWSRLAGQGAFKSASESARHLLPEWLIQILKDRRLGSGFG